MAGAALPSLLLALLPAVTLAQTQPAERTLFVQAGLDDAEVQALEVPTRFENIDDFWRPFEGGQGPAPGYLMSLDDERRAELRATVASRLPPSTDGSISLVARAWGVRGIV